MTGSTGSAPSAPGEAVDAPHAVDHAALASGWPGARQLRTIRQPGSCDPPGMEAGAPRHQGPNVLLSWRLTAPSDRSWSERRHPMSRGNVEGERPAAWGVNPSSGGATTPAAGPFSDLRLWRPRRRRRRRRQTMQL